MKKILFTALALAAIASCTKSNEPAPAPGTDDPVEIKINAGISATVKAPVSPGTALSGIYFARVDGTSPVWTGVAAADLISGSLATDGKVTLASTQYYPVDGSNANLVALYNGGTTVTTIADGKVDVTITGDEDVMYAGVQSGSKTTAVPQMTLDHKLTQFSFVIKREESSTGGADAANDITGVKVTVNNANTTFKLNLADGTLSDWNTPISTLAPFNAAAGDKATVAGTASTSVYMLEPELASLSLQVEASNYASQAVTVNGSDEGKFEAGKAYTITLTFKGSDITPSAAIAQWQNGTNPPEAGIK